MLDGHHFDTLPVNAAVGLPQGSILGKVLFLVDFDNRAKNLACVIRL